ncbi:hypothetical protein Gotur_007253 [Gossypium turneri]
MQAYFPERLAKCYIVHMPRFFVSVWRMVSRFIEKSTLEKVFVIVLFFLPFRFLADIGNELTVPNVLFLLYGGEYMFPKWRLLHLCTLKIVTGSRVLLMIIFRDPGIVIVTNDDEKKIFIEEIGEEALPVEYGGKAILRAIQDVQTFDNTVAAPEGVKPSNDQCCCQ